MQATEGDGLVTSWCGSYSLARDDPYFARAVAAGRMYADKRATSLILSAVW